MKLQQFVRRVIPLLAVALLLGVALRVSSAAAAPPTRVFLGSGSGPISGVCPFVVQFTTTTANEYLTTFTDNSGHITMRILTGTLKVTLTNLSTGYSQDLNISGPGQNTYNPDGSGQLRATGGNLFWGPVNSLANLPPLAYTDGPITFQFDSQDNITSVTFEGHATDECAALNH